MSYMKSKWVSRDKKYIIEKKYHTWRYHSEKSKREKRSPKEKVTSEKQEKRNRELRKEKLIMLALDNFHMGDSYLTLTCRDRLPPEVLKAEFEKFKRKLRTIFRKRGKELKYISVLENAAKGKRGRPHGHILVPGIPQEDMAAVIAAWPHGHVKFSVYKGALSDATNLMSYFVKEEIDRETGSGRVMPSRNLIRRKPKKETVTRADSYRDNMKPPKGYHLLPHLSCNTFTEDGYPLQIAYFERDEQFGKRRRGTVE